jgi:hypothetical protein
MYKIISYSPESGSAFYERDGQAYYIGYPYREKSASKIKNLELAMYGSLGFLERELELDSFDDLVAFLSHEFLNYGDRVNESREDLIAEIKDLQENLDPSRLARLKKQVNVRIAENDQCSFLDLPSYSAPIITIRIDGYNADNMIRVQSMIRKYLEFAEKGAEIHIETKS